MLNLTNTALLKQKTKIPMCTARFRNITIETSRFNATPEDDRLCLLCEQIEIENEVYILSYWTVYKDVKDVLLSKMSSIYVDCFWLNDYKRLELCFRKGTLFLTDFICQARERSQNILFKTKL